MPPKKKPLDPAIVDVIWAAGVISSSGSLKLVNTGKTKVVRYVVTSSILPGCINRLAKVLGTNITTINQSNTINESLRIALQGAALHATLTRVWDYLTMERKQQYALLRKQITATAEGPNPYREDTKIEEFGEDE